MKKRKLVSALVLCSMIVLSANADIDLSGIIENQTNGAAINVDNGTINVAVDTVIQNNTGAASGGITNAVGGTIDVGAGSKFINNSTNQGWAGGGAIYSYHQNSKIDIDNNVTFDGNHTLIQEGCDEGSGGAIYMGDSSGNGTTTLEIGNNVSFTNNSTNEAKHSMGGALYIENTDVSVGKDLTVSGNKAYQSGGAININNDASGKTASIGTDAEFTGNISTTGSGGAISSEGTNFTIGTGAYFEDNKAGVNGGAISVSSGQSGDKTFTIGSGAEFVNNSANNGNGGAIYNTGKVDVQGAEFTGNSAKAGGAIYNAAGATAELTDVKVNAADTNGKNDIVNAGTTTTSGTNTFASDIKNESTGKITFGGTNTITADSNVSGSGEITNSGTLNLEGNASEYTGKFTQSDSNAVTNITGTFFNGKNDIKAGALNIGSDSKVGSLTLGTNSTVADAVNMNIYENSELTLSGGDAVLNSGDAWKGTVSMSGGTLTLNGLTSNEIGIIQATGGNLVIADGTNFSAKDGSSISGVNTQIEAGGTYAVTDGISLTMDDDNEWEGTVSLQGGDFTVDGRKETTGNGTFTSNDNDKGRLNVINNGNLDIASGSNIAKNVTTYIETGSTVSIEGGEATLNSGDTWAGNVNLTSGTLTVNNVENGAINATGGTLELENQNFEVDSLSKIDSAVAVSIDKDSTLNVNGGEVTLNGGATGADTWDGKVELNDGTLNLDSIACGILKATNGNLKISGGDVEINKNVTIDAPVVLTTENGSNIDIIEGGVITLDNGDTIGGTATLDGGILNYGISDINKSTDIIANAGHLNLLGGSNYVIGTGSTFEDDVVVDIQKGATVIAESGTTFNLNGGKDDASLNDKWNGTIVNDGGTINADKMVSSGTSALIHTQGSNGVTNIDNYSQILLDSDVSKVEGGTVNVINNSTLGMLDASNMHLCDLNVDSTSKFVSYDNAFDLNTLNHAGLLIGQNNALEDYNIRDTMNIGSGNDNQADFTIDVYGRSNATDEHGSDRFIANVIRNNSTNGEPAVVNISDWNLGGDIFGWDAPIDKHINLAQIFNYNTLDGNVEFNVTDKEVFTPIGWYKLNGAPNSPGGMTLDLTRFNPQVYRGQVTTIAQWMNQLAIDDMLFNHSMVLPSFKEEDGGIAYGGMMANRYAAIDPQFAPYQYSRKDGGLWYKMYGTFETLQMSQGLSNVGNNAYGSIIGADFGLKELKNGWKFMPTAYIGYNGAHQYYSGIGAYQNGGQAGFLGTWYKNNFIIGGLVYGGVYQNSMDIAGHTDNTFNYFAGALHTISSVSRIGIQILVRWV